MCVFVHVELTSPTLNLYYTNGWLNIQCALKYKATTGTESNALGLTLVPSLRTSSVTPSRIFDAMVIKFLMQNRLYI